MKRINKRYPYIHAGTKVKRHARIAISIDQSGSVDDDMLAKFFTELNSLAKIAEFTVIPFDTDISDSQVYVWKKGKYRKIERVRQGGTDFNAPTEYVNGKDFDGHIVLTDMQAPKPISSKCQRMWMTTKECMNSLYFTTTERIIPVE
jgi:predicted metal-dependent peptidase